MKFGTDAFFSYLKMNIIEINYDTFYDEVASVVNDDTKAVLYTKGIRPSKNITEEDIEDIFQEVHCAVVKGLDSFIKNSGDLSEGQRNHWLVGIINNKVKDFFRMYYKKVAFSNVPYDISDYYINVSNKPSIDCDYAEFDKFCQILKCVFNIGTTPDKMIAYVFSKLAATNSSGSPRTVVEQLYGKPIEYAFKLLKENIREIFKFEVPDDVFAELEKKINDVRNEDKKEKWLFDLNAETIKDSTYKIKTSIDDNIHKDDKTEEKRR